MKNIPEGTDRGLITKDNCAVAFIDIQPQMIFGVGNIARDTLINNITMLAKAAKLFNVPTILTTVEAESFSGYCMEFLQNVFPDSTPIPRTGMNAWDFENFRNAIRATGKKNIILSGLWTEVCVCWPALSMIEEGFNIFVAEDACGGVSRMIHNGAMRRMEKAGVIPVSAMQMMLEFQRDWANKDTYDACTELIHQHAGAYGVGIEYAKTWCPKKH